ncbi:UNVERIFIED_CONTAM: hypothetical protein FKN15_037592 [Acipenser sinensis]
MHRIAACYSSLAQQGGHGSEVPETSGLMPAAPRTLPLGRLHIHPLQTWLNSRIFQPILNRDRLLTVTATQHNSSGELKASGHSLIPPASQSHLYTQELNSRYLLLEDKGTGSLRDIFYKLL